MPKVCRYKPNRTFPRLFSSCDAARIAREVAKQKKDTPEEIMACIAKGLGFTHISLSRSGTVVESRVTLSKGTIQSAINGLKIVLSIVKSRFPSIAARIAAIIDALDKVSRFIDSILDNPRQERVEDVLPEGKCKCKDQPKTKEV